MGLPVGTAARGYGSVLLTDSFFFPTYGFLAAVSNTSTTRGNYFQSFGVFNTPMPGLLHTDGTTYPVVCGVYSSGCGASAQLLGNAILGMTFIGNQSGTFTRVYRQYAAGDALCAVPQVEYSLSGSFSLASVSDCGGDCIFVSRHFCLVFVC
jgi:hypothetical protein